MSTPWSERPIEQARLLNPAFLAALLWETAAGYRSARDSGLPYALSFVAMPIILHKPTRDALPKTLKTSLVAWIAENPQVHVQFAARSASLVPFVKEGLLLGVNGGLLEISSSQIFSLKRPKTMAGFLRDASDEVSACMKKADFVGKWFEASGDYVTVMALWGVLP